MCSPRAWIRGIPTLLIRNVSNVPWIFYAYEGQRFSYNFVCNSIYPVVKEHCLYIVTYVRSISTSKDALDRKPIHLHRWAIALHTLEDGDFLAKNVKIY